MPLDHRMLLAISGLAGRSPAADAVGIFFASYSPYVLAIGLLALWLVFPGSGNRARQAALAAAVAAVLGLIVAVAIGHLAPYRPRPFLALPALVHPLIHHGTDTSLPSDHATLAFAVTVGLLPAGRGYRYGLLFALLVAVARVFVGAHWPSDVVAGALVGTAAALVVRALPRPMAALYRFALALTPRFLMRQAPDR